MSLQQALQKTHQYGKAINYYKEAVKTEENALLRYDMAELQMKLKQYEKAERTVAQALDAENNGQKSDLNSLMTQVLLVGKHFFVPCPLRENTKSEG